MKKTGSILFLGRPNSGKSTLFNTVCKMELSIVTSKAQTTRDCIRGIFTDPARGQMIFIDTPGVHAAHSIAMNRFMMSTLQDALKRKNDLIWYVVDVSSSLEEEKLVLERLLSVSNKIPIFLVMNKNDLRSDQESFLAAQIKKILLENQKNLKSSFFVSGLRNLGVDHLVDASWEVLPERLFAFEDELQASDRPIRFFLEEKIRCEIFKQVGQEVPYSCAVKVEHFQEKTSPQRIEALIFVEKDSQKGILIGKNGKKIKSIGQSARKEIEGFLKAPVFLGLKVKHLPNWRKEEKYLKKIGYF